MRASGARLMKQRRKGGFQFTYIEPFGFDPIAELDGITSHEEAQRLAAEAASGDSSRMYAARKAWL